MENCVADFLKEIDLKTGFFKYNIEPRLTSRGPPLMIAQGNSMGEIIRYTGYEDTK